MNRLFSIAVGLVLLSAELTQAQNQIITDNIVTAEELSSRIFNRGVIDVRPDGSLLYEADFEDPSSAQIGAPFYVTGSKIAPPIINPQQIQDGVFHASDLWQSIPALEQYDYGRFDWNNAAQTLSDKKGSRLFISSYKNAVSGTAEVTQPRLKRRPRVASKKPDHGRKYILGTTSSQPPVDTDSSAVAGYFSTDSLETNIKKDKKKTDISSETAPQPSLKINLSPNDSRMNIFLETPKMNPHDSPGLFQ